MTCEHQGVNLGDSETRQSRFGYIGQVAIRPTVEAVEALPDKLVAVALDKVAKLVWLEVRPDVAAR
jgi:hypothetical protein